MLAGMAGHYFFTLYMIPSDVRPRFEVTSLLAPTFASPLVFIPLLASLQNSEIDLATLTLPKFMVFFVAFENGFFWKAMVDNERERRLGKDRRARRT